MVAPAGKDPYNPALYEMLAFGEMWTCFNEMIRHLLENGDDLVFTKEGDGIFSFSYG